MSTSSIDLSPKTPAGYERAWKALARQMATWARSTGRGLKSGDGEQLAHYKWGYLDGHLGRWTKKDLDRIFLEIYPAKMMAEGEELDELLEEAKAFISFLAQAGYLEEESDDPTELCRHIDTLEAEFCRRMAERTRYSSGKRIWTALADQGISPEDTAAVQSWFRCFNALPRAEREVVLGTGENPSPWEGQGRFAVPAQQNPALREQRGEE